MDRFVPVVDIDPGEALLYTSLVEHPTYAVLSGDKRSISALCAASELQAVREAVSGRVICLEQLLDELVAAHGADVIGQAFAPVRSHKTLSIVFTETTMTDQEQCRYAIGSYIRNLKVTVGDTFLREINRT